MRTAHGMTVYVRALIAEALLQPQGISLTDYDETHVASRLITDCKSLFDHLKSDGKVPEDRHTAIWVAALRCGVAAGPGIRPSKTPLLWTPSRWQLADGLTKYGLDKAFRLRLTEGRTKLHEESAQSIKRGKDAEQQKG